MSLILEKLAGLSGRHTLKIQRPWFSSDGQREVTLEVLAQWISANTSGGGGGGPIVAADIADSTASGRAVITGTPAQGLAALEGLPINNPTATGTLTVPTITGVTGLALLAGGSGNRDITLTPTAEGEVVIAGPTGLGAGRRIRVLGVPVSGTNITSRGGKSWGFTSGGGAFTASSGVYAGQSEIDAVHGWFYNPTSGSPNDDVQWGQAFESRYLNASSDLSSEWYLSWQSPLHGAGNLDYLNRRPIQVNVSHEDTGIAGGAFRVDWSLSAETFQINGSSVRTATSAGGTLNNDRFFRVLFGGTDHKTETSGSFSALGTGTFGGVIVSTANTGTNILAANLDISGNKRLRIGEGTTAPLSLEQSSGGQQGLTLFNGGLAQYTRYHTGIDASGAGNYLDFIGASSAPTNWLIRQSSNDGATMTQAAQLHSSGRWIIGASSDNGTDRLQVIGAVNAIAGGSTTRGVTTDGTISVNTLNGAAGILLSGGTIGSNAGIWLGTNASGTPSSSNYAILGNATTTIINAPSGGSVLLRNNNGTKVTISGSSVMVDSGSTVAFQNTTESTSTTTGSTVISGGVGVAKRLTANVVKTSGFTVATLPAGSVGDRAYVTDALTPTFLGVLVGGGAVTTPVFFNGSAWVSA